MYYIEFWDPKIDFNLLKDDEAGQGKHPIQYKMKFFKKRSKLKMFEILGKESIINNKYFSLLTESNFCQIKAAWVLARNVASPLLRV